MNLEVIHHPAQGQAHLTPLLFIHGKWHGAWCWQEHFLPYFAGKGYECAALSLRGHGNSEGRERIGWHTIADYVADVELGRPAGVLVEEGAGMHGGALRHRFVGRNRAVRFLA